MVNCADDKILAFSKLEAFAEGNFSLTQVVHFYATASKDQGHIVLPWSSMRLSAQT